MKQHRIFFQALSALLCLVLCTQLTACGQKDTFSPASGKRYDNSLITEVLSEEGTFTDEYDQDWDYSYHIPQLEADTPDAEKINAQIMAVYGDDVRSSLVDAAVPKMPETYYESVSWQSHWNESLLSLSIKAQSWGGIMTDYQVYHFDFASGKQLTNTQLLDRFEID